MIKKLLVFPMLLVMLSACSVSDRLRFAMSSSPIEKSAESVSRGEVIYQTNCSGCHGENAQGDGPLASSLSVNPRNLAASRAPDGVLAMRIVYGVGEQMPAWKGIISEDGVWEVVHFILSKRDPDTNQNRWWK